MKWQKPVLLQITSTAGETFCIPNQCNGGSGNVDCKMGVTAANKCNKGVAHK
jgi:hypothetical protein